MKYLHILKASKLTCVCSYIGLTGSIFMTLAISTERFLGVCYPLQLPRQTRKAAAYIIPVLTISLATNIPRFFDAEYDMDYKEVSS